MTMKPKNKQNSKPCPEIAAKMVSRLILASASPRRVELLRQIGLDPEVQPSDIPEVIETDEPELAVMSLSEQKAANVALRYSGLPVVVIGADTVVAVGGNILGKPIDEADAVRMLGLIQDRIHQVFTGVTIIDCRTGSKVVFAEQTDVHVYPISDDEINQYVKSGESIDKAGGYGIQGSFAAHIKEISGNYHNVVGLPVGRVWQELKKMSD